MRLKNCKKYKISYATIKLGNSGLIKCLEDQKYRSFMRIYESINLEINKRKIGLNEKNIYSINENPSLSDYNLSIDLKNSISKFNDRLKIIEVIWEPIKKTVVRRLIFFGFIEDQLKITTVFSINSDKSQEIKLYWTISQPENLFKLGSCLQLIEKSQRIISAEIESFMFHDQDSGNQLSIYIPKLVEIDVKILKKMKFLTLILNNECLEEAFLFVFMRMAQPQIFSGCAIISMGNINNYWPYLFAALTSSIYGTELSEKSFFERFHRSAYTPLLWNLYNHRLSKNVIEYLLSMEELHILIIFGPIDPVEIKKIVSLMELKKHPDASSSICIVDSDKKRIKSYEQSLKNLNSKFKKIYSLDKLESKKYDKIKSIMENIRLINLEKDLNFNIDNIKDFVYISSKKMESFYKYHSGMEDPYFDYAHDMVVILPNDPSIAALSIPLVKYLNAYPIILDRQNKQKSKFIVNKLKKLEKEKKIKYNIVYYIGTELSKATIKDIIDNNFRLYRIIGETPRDIDKKIAINLIKFHLLDRFFQAEIESGNKYFKQYTSNILSEKGFKNEYKKISEIYKEDGLINLEFVQQFYEKISFELIIDIFPWFILSISNIININQLIFVNYGKKTIYNLYTASQYSISHMFSPILILNSFSNDDREKIRNMLVDLDKTVENYNFSGIDINKIKNLGEYLYGKTIPDQTKSFVEKLSKNLPAMYHIAKIYSVEKEIKKEMLEMLKNVEPEFYITFIINEQEIPVELIWDRKGPWALRHAMGKFVGPDIFACLNNVSRSVLSKQMPHGFRKALIIGSSPKNYPELKESKRELVLITEFLETIGFGIKNVHNPTKLEFIENICGNNDIVHFSGHGINNEFLPDNSALVLQEEIVTANEIRHNIHLSGHPVVFTNACTTGRITYSGDFAAGLSTAFLSSGASNYIGTLWPVSDDVAVWVASNFYANLIYFRPLGQILMYIKKSIKELFKGDLSWASYSLCGDPTLKIDIYIPPDDISKLSKKYDKIGKLFKLRQFDLSKFSNRFE